MNCIKCGRTIESDQMFCAVCSMPTVETVQTPPKPAKKKKKAVQKKVKKAMVNRKLTLRLAIALAVALVLLIGVTVLAVREQRSYLARTNDLRVREADVALRERAADAKDNRIAQLEQQLDDANTIIQSQQNALDAISPESEDGSVERSLLREENEQLTATIADLQQQMQALRSEKATADMLAEELQAADDFLRANVVLVPNDGSKLYHRYGCPEFTAKDFWAYSPKLAEYAGYKPCPRCAIS